MIYSGSVGPLCARLSLEVKRVGDWMGDGEKIGQAHALCSHPHVRSQNTVPTIRISERHVPKWRASVGVCIHGWVQFEKFSLRNQMRFDVSTQKNWNIRRNPQIEQVCIVIFAPRPTCIYFVPLEASPDVVCARSAPTLQWTRTVFDAQPAHTFRACERMHAINAWATDRLGDQLIKNWTIR